MTIHPTAIVDRSAEIASDVVVGPHCIIGPEVRIGSGSILDPYTHICRWTTVGRNCRFHSHCVIGGDPQDLKYQGEATWLQIGNANVIREFVTLNRGTQGGGGVTRIGDENLFMAYCHVAHDSQVGSSIIMANAATLAGHVLVEDHSTIGAFSAVHQFCRIGPHAFIGGFSVITRDALPYIKTVGDRNHAKIYGINSVGLQRKSLPERSIEELKQVYRVLFRSKMNTTEALLKAHETAWTAPEVATLMQFMESSHRGFIR
jgi:UDP-N-acetylglucosamine acyltransferase